MSRLLVIAGLVLCGSMTAFAADKADSKSEGKSEVIHSKLSGGTASCGAACQVNFVKELGVPLDFLGSIGHRISLARKSPDPVELALAAQSLGVAEKVAGKKASITSDAVMKEAVELGQMRGISTELAALALIASDDATKKALTKAVSEAKERESDVAAAVKTGEASKELFGPLTVDNHTNECLRIFVSGRYYGTVHSGQRGQFHVHDHNNPTTVEAYCEHDGELVRSAYKYGHYHSLYWHID